jgi:hypothetical protein
MSLPQSCWFDRIVLAMTASMTAALTAVSQVPFSGFTIKVAEACLEKA